MRIAESLDQIMSQQKLITERFYTEKLFQAYPEFVSFFSSTNMRVQQLMLMMALQGVGRVLGSSPPAVEEYLRYLGTRHRKHGIPPEFFPKFCEMLVATIADFHGEAWSDELAQEWRAALARASTIMLEGYREHYHV
jgi:hemoglobin-like flavoprotein